MQSLAKFFDFSSDMVCILDIGCNLKRANPTFGQNLNWSQNPASPFSFFALIHPHDLSQVRYHLSLLISGELDQTSFLVQTQNLAGSFSLVHWKAWRESHEELYLLAKPPGDKLAANKLQTHFQTQNQLFSLIAHDMRNFMGQCQSMGKIMHDGLAEVPDSPLGKMAEQNYHTTKRLFFLLENLLSWTQIQKGELQWNAEEIPVSDWVEDTLALFQPLAAMKQIRLCAEGPWPDSIRGDRQVMSAILRNLLSNALKFTPAEGEVRVHFAQKNQQWWLSVSDNGIGIPPDHLDRLRNRQSSNTRLGTAQEKGKGLGLRLCQDLLLLYGGELNLNSQEGKGTQTAFSLPATSLIAENQPSSAYPLSLNQVQAQA